MPQSISGRTALSAAFLSFAILSSLLVSVAVASAQNSDFSIDSNPLTLCVNPGINGRTTITLSSIGGFSGTVNLGDSVSPSYNNGPTLSSIPSSETLASGQSVSFDLTIYTTTATPLFNYQVTVSGLSGALHSVTILLSVSTACSVGGTIVPTALGTMGSALIIAVAITGLVGIATAAMVVYVSRARNSNRP